MKQLNISDARQNFSKVLENIYFQGEEVLITKNNIPLVKITAIGKTAKLAKERKIIAQAFGIWKDIKGNTADIARQLRKESWVGKYAD